MKRFFLLLLIPLTSFSQSQETRYVVVKGTAELKVPIDYFQVYVSIPSFSANTKAASDSNRAAVLRMMDVVRKYGVADSDFQTNNNTSRLDINAKEPDHRCVVTYVAQFNLRRFRSYDSLFQDLQSLGGIDVSVSGNGSNISPYYKMLAYQKAFKAAHHEAEVLMATSHQKLGRLIKLIQDNRDVFTQYDDLDQILKQSVGTQTLEYRYGYANIAATQMSAERIFRREFYTQSAEVTAIFAIE
ncbi:MAG TPA: SIMPL domain-containing protein [Bacteroidota bacterium]|nr:SIMPL domain-containing protein [Bacteroidota bacterium]